MSPEAHRRRPHLLVRRRVGGLRPRHLQPLAPVRRAVPASSLRPHRREDRWPASSIGSPTSGSKVTAWTRWGELMPAAGKFRDGGRATASRCSGRPDEQGLLSVPSVVHGQTSTAFAELAATTAVPGNTSCTGSPGRSLPSVPAQGPDRTRSTPADWQIRPSSASLNASPPE